MKVPREIKEKLEKAGVSPSKVMKEALKEIELKELEKEIEKFNEILNKISIERVR